LAEEVNRPGNFRGSDPAEPGRTVKKNGKKRPITIMNDEKQPIQARSTTILGLANAARVMFESEFCPDGLSHSFLEQSIRTIQSQMTHLQAVVDLNRGELGEYRGPI
jgi:hypothetical protein